jgi:hypothetical protein
VAVRDQVSQQSDIVNAIETVKAQKNDVNETYALLLILYAAYTRTTAAVNVQAAKVLA